MFELFTLGARQLRRNGFEHSVLRAGVVRKLPWVAQVILELSKQEITICSFHTTYDVARVIDYYQSNISRIKISEHVIQSTLLSPHSS